MKIFKRIISFILVPVTIFLLFPVSAYASVGGNFTSSSNFWTWAANQSDWLKDFLSYKNAFVGSDSVCPASDDSLHHASSGGNAFRGLDGKMQIQCFCDDCKAMFTVKMSVDDYLNLVKPAYDDYVTDTVQPELVTTIIGSDCVIIPISVDSVNGQSDGLFSPGFSFSFRRLTSKQCNFSFNIVFYSAPLSGTYEFCTDVSLDNCEFYHSMYSSSMYPGDLFTYNKSAYIDKDVYLYGYSPQFNISGSFFFKVDPFEYSVNDYTASVGGQSSRPTSLTGDYGIMGDNGTITKTDNTYIFDETTNNYYNPCTGSTTNITDWTYDYSDRSYNLTTESGDTVTVTYGDENITIQEGDQTYNVYYITINQGGDAHTHDWSLSDSTPPTCTAPGSNTYTCSDCGETKTETVPAAGHKWQVKRTVTTQYDESGNLIQEGYTLYECSVCGEQYKAPSGSTVPPSGGGSSDDDSGGGFFSWLFKLLKDFFNWFFEETMDILDIGDWFHWFDNDSKAASGLNPPASEA